MVSKHCLIVIKDQDLEKPTGHKPVKISFYHLNYLLYMTPYTLEAAMQILSVYDSYTWT